MGNLYKFLRAAIYVAVNALLLYSYTIVFDKPLRIVETVLIICSGSLLSFCIYAFVISPSQFFKALTERLIYPFILIFAILLRLFGIVVSLVIRSIRLVLALILIVVYGASPVDILPEIILGPIGLIDDVVLTIVILYWGLKFGRIAFSHDLRDTSYGLLQTYKINTKFPTYEKQ